MIVFILVGVGLLAAGIWRLYSSTRIGELADPRWLSMMRAGAEALAWISGAACCVLTGTRGNVATVWIAATVWVILVALALAWSASWLLRRMHTTSETQFRAFVLHEARRGLKHTRSALRDWVRIIAPTGWHEVRLGSRSLERLLEPLTMVREYLFGLLLVPILLALSVAWALNSGSISQHSIMGAYLGYTAWSIVSCLTAALIVTLGVLRILTYVEALRIRFDIQGAFRTIAVWTGYGTAAGVVTAALLPFMSGVVSSGAPGAEEDAVALTPQLLVDVPAAAAVIGYAVGIARAVVVVFDNAENLILRRFVAPSALLIVLIVLAQFGYGPDGILRALASSMPDIDVADCAGDALGDHLDEPAWLLKALDVCGGNSVRLEDQPFLWFVGIVVGIFSLGAFVVDFMRCDARRVN